MNSISNALPPCKKVDCKIEIVLGITSHYYKMWVQFISPHSLDQWIHYFPISPYLLRPVNSLKI